MRILYLVTRAEHGGAQAHLLYLVQQAARQGEVLVGLGEEGKLREQLRVLGVDSVVLGHLRHDLHALHDLAGVVEISALIRRFQPDLIHAHSSKAGLLGRLAAAWQQTPSIYTAHGFAFGPGASPKSKLPALVGEWLAGRLGKFTIAVSRSECRIGREFGVSRPGHRAFIYNGVRDSGLRAVPEAAPPVIAMVARFASPKQQAALIRSFSRITGDARLWLVGNGPTWPEARDLARRSGKEPEIVFWGDRDDVPELLAQCQIGVLISEHEGFGLSLIEAMSVGLPVIASDCGGMREIVRHGENGILVPCQDEPALTKAIDELIANPRLRRDMGKRGLADFQAHFTSEVMVEETFRIYDELLRTSSDGMHRGRCSGTCATCQRPLAVAGD